MASNTPEKIRKASCQQWKLLLRLSLEKWGLFTVRPVKTTGIIKSCKHISMGTKGKRIYDLQ